jgi:hypothetical protein
MKWYLFAVTYAVVTDNMQSLHCFHIFSQKNEWDKIVITFVCEGHTHTAPPPSPVNITGQVKSKITLGTFGTGRLRKRERRGRGEKRGALFNDTVHNG